MQILIFFSFQCIYDLLFYLQKVEDGVHIGLIPKDAYKEDPKDTRSDQKMSLMKRIPRDAEACTVLVGCVDYLEKPAMAFVRLAEKQVSSSCTL